MVSRARYERRDDAGKAKLAVMILEGVITLQNRRRFVRLGGLDVSHPPTLHDLMAFDLATIVGFFVAVRAELDATRELGAVPSRRFDLGFSPWIDQFGRDIGEKSG